MAQPLVPYSGGEKQVDPCEFRASLAYILLQDSQGYETPSQKRKQVAKTNENTHEHHRA